MQLGKEVCGDVCRCDEEVQDAGDVCGPYHVLKEKGTMLHQQGPAQLPLMGALLLCLLVGISLLAWRWFAHSESSDSTARHSVETPAEDVLKYWTADRMRKARATNMPHIGAPERKKPHPRWPPRMPGQQKP